MKKCDWVRYKTIIVLNSMANTTGKKYGGREKGTPNRLTKELRSILKDIVYQELEDIKKIRQIRTKGNNRICY